MKKLLQGKKLGRKVKWFLTPYWVLSCSCWISDNEFFQGFPVQGNILCFLIPDNTCTLNPCYEGLGRPSDRSTSKVDMSGFLGFFWKTGVAGCSAQVGVNQLKLCPIYRSYQWMEKWGHTAFGIGECWDQPEPSIPEWNIQRMFSIWNWDWWGCGPCSSPRNIWLTSQSFHTMKVQSHFLMAGTCNTLLGMWWDSSLEWGCPSRSLL